MGVIVTRMGKLLRGISSALMILIFSASVSLAVDAEVLLKLLLQKGIITQAEYSEVVGEFNESEGLEKRVDKVEQKAADLAQKQDQDIEEQKHWIEHVDKHLTHAEDAEKGFVNGLSIAGGITMVAQGTSGNDGNVPPEEDVIDGSISADLELSARTGEHSEAFVHMEAGAGDGLEGDEVDSFWGVNADAGDSESRFELTEAWFEQRFSNDTSFFTAGMLCPTNYFDGNEIANDETSQFLSPGFVNSIAVEFPDNGPGARVTLSPHELIDITAGYQSGDGDWEDIFEKPFLMAEANIKPVFGGLQGNYRLYAWSNNTDHEELSNPDNNEEHGWGTGLSIDQQAAESLTVFARLGFQDEDIYEIKTAWSIGMAVSGTQWGRDDDVLGIAYGQAALSDDYRDSLESDGIDPENEGHFEAYYNITVNEHVSVTPDIQVLTNAKGDGGFDTVWTGAVRGQIGF